MDAGRPRPRIRFGTFELDLHSGELRKQGQRIRVQPQPLKVLALLLERHGELVCREEFHKRLWPDEVYVDFEHGLNRSINKLRHALLDDASSPRYIETLSTRGYRFIAPIEADAGASDMNPAAVGRDADPVADAVENAQRAPWNWERRLVVAAGFLVVFALTVFSLWQPLRSSGGATESNQPLKPVPLVTFANGEQWLPAFSPDGSRVAYSWLTEGGWYLEVKEVGTDTRLRLTQHAGDFPPGPSWSPDGRQIAFVRAGQTDRGIFVISSIGGRERKLRSLALWHVPQRIVNWSPDGRWIAFADETSPDGGVTSKARGANAIYLISPETLETRQLTHPPAGDYGDAAPAFSPDGRTIAFVRTRADSHDEIYSISVQGGTPRRLVTDGLWTNGLAWTSDGRSIVFDRSLAGGFRLWRVSATGRDAGPLDIPSNGENYLEPTLWHDRLAYESHDTMQTVGRIALNGSRGETPAALVSSTRREHGGRYSPDGSRIAFISDRTGSDEMWMADADGTNAVQLTRLKTPLVDLSWDPDGRSIAVSTYSGKVFQVALETQGLRLLFEGLPFTDEGHNIAFSRDGRSLYVLSQPGTGESYDLLNVPVAGGSPAKVIAGRLTNFAESMDGTMLFYSRADGLWRRSVQGGAEQRVAPPTFSLWDLGKDGVYVLTNSSSMEFHSLDGRRVTSIAKLGHFDVRFPLSISPDGRLALFGYAQRQTVEVDMVQGFR